MERSKYKSSYKINYKKIHRNQNVRKQDLMVIERTVYTKAIKQVYKIAMKKITLPMTF